MLSAIVVAAGRSSRFSRFNSSAAGGGIPPGVEKGKISKVLLKINSKPVIYYSLFSLSRHPDVNEIIVVANSGNIKAITEAVRKYKIKKVKKIILGGKDRQDSVLKGLNSLNPAVDFVLIHDGARPFIARVVVSSVINAARKYGAAVVGVPVKATVKRTNADFWVKETVDRNSLWEIQTPQVFLKGLILKAYKNSGNLKVTDDSMLVERLKAKVKLVLGSYSNIKITSPEDLIIAKGLANKCKCA